MKYIVNAIEQNLLDDITNLYNSDLDSEIHSYLHIECLACSKRAVINIIERHRRLILAQQSNWLSDPAQTDYR